jgi:hypothetical protein
MIGNDPLSRQIMSKTAQENGGVTAAVRVGSGQVIELKMIDTAVAPAAQLAPAAATPILNLKPAAGLVAKPIKPKKAPRTTVEHLKVIAKEKSWTKS